MIHFKEILPDWPKKEKQFNRLSEQERKILALLAVSCIGCTQTSLVELLRFLRLRNPNGKIYTGRTLKPVLQGLEKKRIVERDGSRFHASPPMGMLALLHVLRQDSFNDIIKALEAQYPHRYSALYNDYGHCCREVLQAIFLGTSREELEEALRKAEKAYKRAYLEKPPLDKLFFSPWHPRLLEHLPVEHHSWLLVHLLKRSVHHLLPVHDADALLDQLTAHWQRQAREQNKSPFALPELCLLMDRAERAEELINDPAMPEVQQHYLLAWLTMLRGATGQALDHFDRHIRLFKKSTRKRTVVLQDFGGFLYLLALLRSRDPDRFAEGMQYIGLLARRFKRTREPEIQLCIDLQPCFAEQLAMDPAESRLLYGSRPLLELIMRLMIGAWIDKKSARKAVPLLRQARDQAIDIQNLWLAAEAAEVLILLGHDVSMNRAIADEIWQLIGLATLTDAYQVVPAWQKTVRALASLAEQAVVAGPDPSDRGERLVWHFHYQEKHRLLNLTPRIQKYSSNGRWSKGRPVALKTLQEQADAMDFLTDQDRQVIAAIHATQEYSSYHRKTVYRLDKTKALLALCGHPLVFLEKSPEVPVELVRAEPELQISRQGNKIRLQLHPDPKTFADGLAIIRERSDRYLVYLLDERQKRLSNILQGHSTFPEQAMEQLRSTIPALASLLPVQSDLGAELDSGIQVEADPTPHARLVPAGDGLQLEFLVRPFRDQGSWFRPGRGRKNVLARLEGRQVMASRDLQMEQTRLARLVQRLQILERAEFLDGRYLIDNPEDSLELLLQLKNCGKDVILEWPKGEHYRIRAESSFTQFSMQLRKDKDWFRIQGSLEVDRDLCLELKELLSALETATGRFIPLSDGSFLALTREFKRRLQELGDYSRPHGKGVRIPPLASLALDGLISRTGKIRGDRAWKQHVARLAEPVSPSLPSTLKAELRPYQLDGYRWLARLAHWQVGGCLADDMGLGKTLQALAVLLHLAEHGPSLVVAPVSVMANWEEEAARFTPTLRIRMFGQGDRQQLLDSLQPFDIVVCSYGLLSLEIDRLARVSWQGVVLDEAQAIKNAATKRSRAAMRLRAAFRLITTGTPVENNLTELWTLFRFLNPGLLGPRKQFRERFAIPIERNQDREAQDRLRKLIRPFLLRRLKSDVLRQLPPRTDITLKIAMGEKEMALYEAQRLLSLEKLTSTAARDKEISPLQILAEITRLRRLCCNPRLVLNDNSIPSAKFDQFVSTLEELLANRHKVLVFSQFVDHLQIVRQHLDRERISYQYLDGSVGAGERKKRVARFQAGEGDVFLISLRAGGTGLNLTAADYVIHLDPWWNPAVEDQASDRAHRIGQDRPVTVYRLVMEGTIEEKIVDLHHRKRRLAEDLLAGGDKIPTLSAAELLSLLKESGSTTEA